MWMDNAVLAGRQGSTLASIACAPHIPISTQATNPETLNSTPVALLRHVCSVPGPHAIL